MDAPSFDQLKILKEARVNYFVEKFSLVCAKPKHEISDLIWGVPWKKTLYRNL